MKVVVFGGRTFTKYGLLFRALDQLHAEYGFTLVIDGKAKGVDTMGNMWAKARGIPFEREPADWEKYGAAAGPIRNELMITKYKPDMGVAFPGGPGTRNMTMLCHQYGITVKTVVPRKITK